MNILEKIIESKRTEVDRRRSDVPLSQLEKGTYFSRKTLSLSRYLHDKTRTGIISEFKRKSPSRGIINDKADVTEVSKGYAANGAACISILTDAHYFGGSNHDLIKARVNEIPILRKDFIIDEYQIVEARSIGADVILLIAACLTPYNVRRLASFARGLELEVLLEIHAEEELDHICEETKIVGINNRDLKTFAVDIDRSLRMAEKIPGDRVKVAESGISYVEDILLFKQHGFKGFLIGEQFMKAPDPTIAFAEFVKRLKAKAHED